MKRIAMLCVLLFSTPALAQEPVRAEVLAENPGADARLRTASLTFKIGAFAFVASALGVVGLAMSKESAGDEAGMRSTAPLAVIPAVLAFASGYTAWRCDAGLTPPDSRP